MADLPGTLPTITRPTGADSFVAGATAGPTVIDEIADELEALATMHGVTGSATATTTDYKVSHGITPGEETWAGMQSVSWSANQNNYALPALVRVLRVTLTGDFDLTGIVPVFTAGQVLTISNITSTSGFDLTLKADSASSTATNRFYLGADIILGKNEGVTIWYDDTTDRWRPIGVGGGTDLLRKSGGTITGDVLAPTPANPTSVATKTYVDAEIASIGSVTTSGLMGQVRYSGGAWPSRATATSSSTQPVMWIGPEPGPTIGGAGNAVNDVDLFVPVP